MVNVNTVAASLASLASPMRSRARQPTHTRAIGYCTRPHSSQRLP